MYVATTPQLERALREARLVVLDLRELTFMDSSGVHAMVDASIRARRVGRRLILLRGRLDVDRLFALTGSSGDVEGGYVDRAEAPIEALPRLEPRKAGCVAWGRTRGRGGTAQSTPSLTLIASPSVRGASRRGPRIHVRVRRCRGSGVR